MLDTEYARLVQYNPPFLVIFLEAFVSIFVSSSLLATMTLLSPLPLSRYILGLLWIGIIGSCILSEMSLLRAVKILSSQPHLPIRTIIFTELLAVLLILVLCQFAIS